MIGLDTQFGFWFFGGYLWDSQLQFYVVVIQSNIYISTNDYGM